MLFETSRERSKSAPYLRIKNGKGASKNQVFYYSTQKLQNNVKKLKGDPLRKEIFEKRLTRPKNRKGDPLISPGFACHAEKRENLFGSVPWAKWFKFYFKLLQNSLGQMLQILLQIASKLLVYWYSGWYGVPFFRCRPRVCVFSPNMMIHMALD